MTRPHRDALAAIGLAAMAATACPKESNDALLMPKLPPPEHATIPTDLHIKVTMFGAPAPPIDHARLSARPPDFIDVDHRAWRLMSLLGVPEARASMTVVGEQGVALTLPLPAHVGAPEPILFLTRRGEVTAALAVPWDPFPKFHGRGRQLARPGDPLPRLAGPLVEVRVTAPDK